ncbi:MAG: hypothetical protein WDN48_09585 [Pseudolabrys sp.]
MIATRRDQGLSAAVPGDVAAAVADVDAVLLDNRYSNITLPICQAAAARGIPRVLDFDKAVPADDPLFQCCSHVIASAEATRGTTGVKDLEAALGKLGESYNGFLAVTDGPAGVFWRDGNDIRIWMRSRSTPSIPWAPVIPFTAASPSGWWKRRCSGIHALRGGHGGDQMHPLRRPDGRADAGRSRCVFEDAERVRARGLQLRLFFSSSCAPACGLPRPAAARASILDINCWATDAGDD